MIYVFDTNILSNIFSNYFFDSFPTFWENFEKLISSSKIISVREVKKELQERGWDNNIDEWMKNNKDFFIYDQLVINKKTSYTKIIIKIYTGGIQ